MTKSLRIFFGENPVEIKRPLDRIHKTLWMLSKSPWMSSFFFCWIDGIEWETAIYCATITKTSRIRTRGQSNEGPVGLEQKFEWGIKFRALATKRDKKWFLLFKRTPKMDYLGLSPAPTEASEDKQKWTEAKRCLTFRRTLHSTEKSLVTREDPKSKF